MIPGCRSDTDLVRGSLQIGQWPPDSGDCPTMTPQWVLASSMELDVGGTDVINTPPALVGVTRSYRGKKKTSQNSRLRHTL